MTNTTGKTGNEAGPPASHAPADLRHSAEERLSEKQRGRKSEGRGQRAAEDTARLVHELRVHQIELEMQNEEVNALLKQAGQPEAYTIVEGKTE